MKITQNLGGFDMVLGLSQTTINYQFFKLHQRNLIRKKWLVGVGNVLNPDQGEKPFHLEGSDDSIQGKIAQWVSNQSQIAKAKSNKKWAEIGELIEKGKALGLNLDYAWDAIINAPTIEIIKNNSGLLYFNLIFSSGKLYYLPEETSEVKIFDLKGLIYSFTVPIGKIKITKDQMLLHADDHLNEIIRESGLQESDFRIESLFLNFQNANISNFDKSRSQFPAETTLPLQVAIESYFNRMLQSSDSPYVLGYGITRPEIKSEKALFQPTSLDFSTSFSQKKIATNQVDGQFSAFNFMMMLQGRSPEKDARVGILPNSLIELGKDTTATIDGVFAMDRERFDEYLHSLDSYLVELFSSQKDVTVDGGAFKLVNGNWVMKARHHAKRIDDTIDTTYTLTRKQIQNQNLGILVEYEFQVGIVIDINALIWTVKEISLSTAGTYTYKEVKEKGKVGKFSFLIKNGKEGKFDLQPNLESPKIAFNEDPNLLHGSFWDVFLEILSFIFLWPIKIAEGIVNQIAVDLGSNSAVIQNKKLESLRKLNVLNQSNQVILPLGKTYTYKNLRYFEKETLIAYDISYAIVIEK
ncbi:hypothetical protein [Algoriphagus sp.]|uniref:hypothetical protein n=1 Tax=Algoriphagus sp. TaxID=1872435 RepID=UPI00260CE6A5|nr:hypothetical protein [Algoriphagus sp.]